MSISPHPSLSPEYTDIINELTDTVRLSNPRDILQFCADFFHAKLAEQRLGWNNLPEADHPCDPLSFEPKSTRSNCPLLYPSSPLVPLPTLQASLEQYSSTDEEDESECDDIKEEEKDTFSGELPDFSMIASSHNRARRTSVSAESMTPSRGSNGYVKTVIPKTVEQQTRIQTAISSNFLFRNLEDTQYKDVINAMAEKLVHCDEVVIQEGDTGDYFYVVESGTFDCYISKNKDKPERITQYGPGGSFGELALMYNSPRAATIVATSSGVLWALDRVTFRRILMENMAQRRYMYERFLTEVPILASLDAYERHKVADALEAVTFEHGDTVIQQGTTGENFYVIESGEAIVYQTDPETGVHKEVNCLSKGAYFGELALLNDSPRAATVIARGRLRCATLGKRGFKRLLGPIMDILKRNSENYARVMREFE